MEQTKFDNKLKKVIDFHHFICKSKMIKIKIFVIIILFLVQAFVSGNSDLSTSHYNTVLVDKLISSAEIVVNLNDIYDYLKNLDNVLVQNPDESSPISKKSNDSDCIKNAIMKLNNNCDGIDELNESERKKCECILYFIYRLIYIINV